MLGSFNGPGPGGPEVTISKVKERKRMILPGLRREPIKSLTQDLGFSRRHQAPSRGGVKAQGAFLRESWKPEQKSELDGFLRSRELAEERKRQKERQTDRQPDRQTRGPKL